MNYIKSNASCQQIHKTPKKPVSKGLFFSKHDPIVKKSIQENPLQIENFSPTEKELLNLLLWFEMNNMRIWPSQSWLADKVDKSREWVNKLLKRFFQLGIIHKVYHYQDVCTYRVSSFFKQTEVRKMLGHILTNIAYSAVLCMTVPNFIFNSNIRADFTQFRQENINNLFTNTDTVLRRETISIDKTIVYKEQKKGEATLHERHLNPSIEKLTGMIGLTTVGQICLTVFPEEALKFAIQKFNPKTTGEPYKIICYWAHQWCKSNDVKVQNGKANYILENNGLTEKMPKTDMKLVVKPASSGTPRTPFPSKYKVRIGPWFSEKSRVVEFDSQKSSIDTQKNQMQVHFSLITDTDNKSQDNSITQKNSDSVCNNCGDLSCRYVESEYLNFENKKNKAGLAWMGMAEDFNPFKCLKGVRAKSEPIVYLSKTAKKNIEIEKQNVVSEEQLFGPNENTYEDLASKTIWEEVI